MKTLMILSCLIVAGVSVARASELHYLPGGQPTCQSEEQEGCEIGHKTAAESPAGTPQSDCFTHEMAAVNSMATFPLTMDQAAAIVAPMCANPSAAVTTCFERSLAAMHDAKKAIRSEDALRAVVKMCSAAK